jgi:hypothetical protein
MMEVSPLDADEPLQKLSFTHPSTFYSPLGCNYIRYSGMFNIKVKFERILQYYIYILLLEIFLLYPLTKGS